jgi:hypothetical protein
MMLQARRIGPFEVKIQKRIKLQFVLSLIFCLSMLPVAWAREKDQFVVLPQSKVTQFPLCSRLGPKVAGIWSPSEKDVLDSESKLGEIAKLRVGGSASGCQVDHPESSLRQYLGIIVGERKLIYVNGFPKDLVPKDWRERFVTVCDGGVSFWGVLYDPQAKTFFDLEANGVG